MVTAPYVFPFGFTFTLAALSDSPVVAPSALTSAVSDIHAPLQRDQPAPAAIRVTWAVSPVPQGYAILASRAANQSEVLNAPRPAVVGGYDVFVGLPPVNPNPNTPPDQQNPAFSDLACKLPLAAPPINNRYLVAAQDIFGQWSGWASTDASLSPAPVTKPGLRSAEFIYTASPGSPPSPILPATLRIDFGWDWQDRAPGQIRFTGQFVPAPATTLNPAYLGGFALKNTGPIGAPVILTFSYSGLNPDTVNPLNVIPTITSGHTSNGPVTILGQGSPPAPASPNQIQYRVELTGIQLDFSSANELDFLIYATATEEVQPGVWSDPTDQPSSSTPASPAPPPLLIGKIVRAINPNPPVVTFTPPPITWTALPDVTGTARGVLQWQVDPTALGYYVWEATESALLHLLPPGIGTLDPAPGTPLPSPRHNTQNAAGHLSGRLAAGLRPPHQRPYRRQQHGDHAARLNRDDVRLPDLRHRPEQRRKHPLLIGCDLRRSPPQRPESAAHHAPLLRLAGRNPGHRSSCADHCRARGLSSLPHTQPGARAERLDHGPRQIRRELDALAGL